jgi:hypothetical protein
VCVRNKSNRRPLKPGHKFCYSDTWPGLQTPFNFRPVRPQFYHRVGLSSPTVALTGTGNSYTRSCSPPDTHFKPSALTLRPIEAHCIRRPRSILPIQGVRIPRDTMPRHVKIHFVPLRSSLVNLPISIYGPLLQRNAVSTRSCLPRHSVMSRHHAETPGHRNTADVSRKEHRGLRWVDRDGLGLISCPFQLPFIC